MNGVVGLRAAELQRLAERARGEAAHLRPLVEAVSRGVPFIMVPRGCPFLVPRRMVDGPAVALFGDDLEDAKGPEAFHLPGLRKLLRAASGVAVMSGAPVPTIYATAPMIALATRRPVVL